MRKKMTSVTKAARNFVLLKNGTSVARLAPEKKKICTGRDLAAALAKKELPEAEAAVWHCELQAARKTLKAPADKRR